MPRFSQYTRVFLLQTSQPFGVSSARTAATFGSLQVTVNELKLVLPAKATAPLSEIVPLQFQCTDLSAVPLLSARWRGDSRGWAPPQRRCAGSGSLIGGSGGATHARSGCVSNAPCSPSLRRPCSHPLSNRSVKKTSLCLCCLADKY